VLCFFNTKKIVRTILTFDCEPKVARRFPQNYFSDTSSSKLNFSAKIDEKITLSKKIHIFFQFIRLACHKK